MIGCIFPLPVCTLSFTELVSGVQGKNLDFYVVI